MTCNASTEDRAFRTAFETGVIPPAEFNHRAHLRLAYTYLCNYNPEVAYKMMREAIQSFLNHHNIDASKYHETITRAWMKAVYHFLMVSKQTESEQEFIQKNSRLLDPKIILTHYFRSVLFSEKARGRFIKPNLDPIPQYSGFN